MSEAWYSRPLDLSPAADLHPHNPPPPPQAVIAIDWELLVIQAGETPRMTERCGGGGGFLQISGEDVQMQQMEAECNKQKEIM